MKGVSKEDAKQLVAPNLTFGNQRSMAHLIRLSYHMPLTLLFFEESMRQAIIQQHAGSAPSTEPAGGDEGEAEEVEELPEEEDGEVDEEVENVD